MDNLMPAVICFLIASLASRIINQKANRKLAPEKKVQLVDLFSTGSIYSYGILLAIIALYFLVARYDLFNQILNLVIYLVALSTFLATRSYLSFKKLKDHEFPDSYIRSYLLSSVLRFLGLIVFFVLLLN